MATRYSPKIITDSLIFCIDAANSRCWDGTGSVTDLAAGREGTPTNATFSSFHGGCIVFDGADDYVSWGDIAWLDGLTVVSASCWFRLDGDPPNSAGILISKDNTLECVVKRSSSNEYSLSINNNHRVFASAPTPAYNEWINVVYTWNSTGDVRKLYLNGGLTDTDTGGNQSGNSLNNSSDGLAVGARANGNYEIDGKIASVHVYAKALTAAEVQQNYIAGKGRFGK